MATQDSAPCATSIMKSESPIVPSTRDSLSDWPKSDSPRNEKLVLKLQEPKMKLAARQLKLDDVKNYGSARKDSEDRRLLMLQGDRTLEDHARLLVDLMGKGFGLGSMVLATMKDTGLIGARVEASTLRMVGERFLGRRLFRHLFLCCQF